MAELVYGDQRVVGDVRDGGADHVQVREEREQWPVAAAARDQIADGVGLDLGHLTDRSADDVEGEVLVPGGPVRTQQAVEELRDGHPAGSLWPCASPQTC